MALSQQAVFIIAAAKKDITVRSSCILFYFFKEMPTGKKENNIFNIFLLLGSLLEYNFFSCIYIWSPASLTLYFKPGLQINLPRQV